MKINHLYGGIVGGIVFGLIAGLLLGSCVFKGGPNHGAMSLEGPRAPQAGMGGDGGRGTMSGGAAAGGAERVPAGMDPGGDVMEAIFAQVSQLKSAIEKNPADRISLVQLANLYYDAAKYDQAIVYYEKAMAIDRNDPNLLTDAGNCHWQTGNPMRALELYREAQERFPDHWQSAASLFFLAASMGDAELAHRSLDRVRKLKPDFDKLSTMEKIDRELTAAAGKGAPG